MYSWKDRLIDWANQKGAWTHILMAAGIALVITASILAAAMPSKGEVDANAVDIGDLQGDFVTIVGSLGMKASQTDLDALSQNVTDALDDQGKGITTIQDSLAGLLNSPLEVYFTGTFGNYMLYTKSNEAGGFTANVHLVYQPARGSAANYTEALANFYTGINFTELTPIYVPVVTFNGSAWGIAEVWFNISIFEMAANTEKTIDITCTGLNSTWEPSFAYVEVYPI